MIRKRRSSSATESPSCQPDGQICQIGSDEEIIRRPANRFVYSFIGVSNFLPVTEKGGKVCLALGGEPRPVRRAAAGVCFR